MRKCFIKFIWCAVLAIAVAACGEKKQTERVYDPQAKEMLQGIWLDADDESIVLRVAGDTLYYNEEGAQPVAILVTSDTLYLCGEEETRYAIERLTPHTFQFRNAAGNVAKLIKSTDEDDIHAFEAGRLDSEEQIIEEEINQRLVKRDTVVVSGGKRYHCYMQVNPTTYKVVGTQYNNEGLSVSKVYYDNIVNIAVFDGARKVYSSDYRKQDFAKFVPKDVMAQSILSDIVYDHVDEGTHATEGARNRAAGGAVGNGAGGGVSNVAGGGVVFLAKLRKPESASAYVVYITVSPTGTATLTQP